MGPIQNVRNPFLIPETYLRHSYYMEKYMKIGSVVPHNCIQIDGYCFTVILSTCCLSNLFDVFYIYMLNVKD